MVRSSTSSHGFDAVYPDYYLRVAVLAPFEGLDRPFLYQDDAL